MYPCRITPYVGLVHLLTLLGTASVVKSSSPSIKCGNDALQWFAAPNGYCYAVVADRRVWHDAEELCRENDGHLVSIHSEAEENIVVERLKNNGIAEDAPVWIGRRSSQSPFLTRLGHTWTDGSPSDYTNFKSSFTPLMKCAIITSESGRWDFVSCGTNLAFMCKSGTGEPPTDMLNVTSPSEDCPPGWTAFRNKCFLPMTKDGSRLLDTWLGAVSSCGSLGAQLVSIHSKAEQNVLSGMIQSLQENVWIGLHDTVNESQFEWMDRTDLDFTFWAPNEPFAAFQTSDCVELWFSAENMGQWRDYSCDIKKAYICQKTKGSSAATTSNSRNTPSPTPTEALELCGETKDGWYLYGGYCYSIQNRIYGFNYAERKCREDSGHLVSIHSQEENNFIKRLLSMNSNMWIGLNAEIWNLKPRWTDGAPLDYLNWNDGQPESILRKERCTIMSPYSGKWLEDDCANQYQYICKRPALSDVETPSQTDCPSGWTSAGNRCFLGVGDLETWQGAEERCAILGGQLASIHNIKVQSVLSAILLTLEQEAWIGLHDTKNETNFEWIDGTKLDFQYWAPHEPMAVLEKSDCVEMWFQKEHFGRWRDFSCDVLKSYICQRKKEISAKPPPVDQTMCPQEFQEWQYSRNGVCFYMETKYPLDWSGANFECSQKGGSLLTTLSEFEIFVVSMYMELEEPAWIGLFRHADGSFAWSDNTPLGFVRWIGDEPSSLSDSCAALDPRTLQWQTRRCTESLPYICMGLKGRIINTTIPEEKNLPQTTVGSVGVPERQRRPEMPSKGRSSGLSPGGIGGVVVLCLLLVICIVVLAFVFLGRQRFRSLLPPFRSEPMCFDNVLYGKDQPDKDGDCRL